MIKNFLLKKYKGALVRKLLATCPKPHLNQNRHNTALNHAVNQFRLVPLPQIRQRHHAQPLAHILHPILLIRRHNSARRHALHPPTTPRLQLSLRPGQHLVQVLYLVARLRLRVLQLLIEHLAPDSGPVQWHFHRFCVQADQLVAD